MKKSKIVLLFKLILIVFLFFYVYFFTHIKEYKSYYNDNDIVYGRIIDYSIKDEYITLVIKGKEKIVANYYYKNKKELNNFKYGYYIKLDGRFSNPSRNTINNLFNYQKYLFNNKIYKIVKMDNYQVKQTNNMLYVIKNSIYDRLETYKSKKYINALLLGNKSYLDSEDKILLKTNGIMHLFAISGMHISIFLSLLSKLLKKESYFKDLLSILFVLFYSFIVSFPASILRILMCLIIKIIFKILGKEFSPLDVLLMSSLILLIINPFYIYDLGFIYSYTLMIFILMFPINKKQKLLRLGALTFMVSAPINIYSFYKVNLLSYIINIISIPIVTFILFPLCIISFIIPYFDCLLFYLFNLFLDINIIFSKLKMFTIVFAKPSIVLIAIYYLSLIVFLRYKNHFLLIISIILLLLNNFFRPSYEVYYMDVKQGDSILVKYPYNQKIILIDTGGIVNHNGSNSYIINNLINYLNSVGISKINYLILTHGDYDHMGEAINLVNNFKVEKVIFNCGSYNDLESELIKVLDKNKIPYYSCIKELYIDKNKLQFLQTKEYDNENDNSNVIYTELNGYKFMFMGDSSITTEKEILDKYNLPVIDVLKVGHHGSKTSSSKEFINDINPKYSIISVGKNNRYGHPNKEVLENLNNSKIYRTDQDGSIMFKIKNNKLQIETCSP